jgi:ADP-heptose:LPS heptosyltransferase
LKNSFLKKLVNNFKEDFPLQIVNFAVFFLDFFIKKNLSENLESTKSILIIRTDLLGDFVVWVNAYKLLIEKYKKENYKIILLGNESWTSLAKKILPCDEIFSINRKKYFKDFSYRKEILNSLNKYNFDYVFQTSYSRDFAIADSLSRNISAKNKIAFKRNKEAEYKIWNFLSDQWYTKLIPVDVNETFEFYRILNYLSNLGIHKAKYSTDFSNEFKWDDIEDNYFVVLPGASAAKRCWEPEKFVFLINRIIELTNLKCVMCGGLSEIELGEYIEVNVQSCIENKIGKTSLIELGNILANSKFVIGNETGTLHYAAALNVQTMCILGGGHFKKVMPYDEKITLNKYLPLAVYKEMECFNCNWRCKYVTEKNMVVPCISNLTTEYILENISGHISKID